MSAVMSFWDQVLQLQNALLPDAVLAQAWVRLGWGLVLGAALAAGITGAGLWRGGEQAQVRSRMLACALAFAALLVCQWPGVLSPAFWLGLAFQAPSLSAGLLSILVLLRCCAQGTGAQWGAVLLVQSRRWTGVAVLLGWVLLLDSFAVWPVALYPLGFGVGTWLALLAVLGGPWAWRGGPWRLHAASGLWVLLLLAFALLRLPSGNVWDAVLDPWLWLLAHGAAANGLYSRYKKRSALRNSAAG